MGRMIIVACVVALAGCTTLAGPWYAHPMKSKLDINVQESPEGEFYLDISATGDVAVAQAFKYRGEAAGDVTPWEMVAGGDVNVTSPALLASVEANRDIALAVFDKLPETLKVILGEPPEAGQELTTWWSRLFDLMSGNSPLLELVLGTIFGP